MPAAAGHTPVPFCSFHFTKSAADRFSYIGNGAADVIGRFQIVVNDITQLNDL